MQTSNREPLLLLLLTIVALIISALQPYNWVIWFLEVFPILIGGPILIITYRRFKLTPLLYRLIFIHALILMLGAHYSYARVPPGFWFQELLNLSRNHYDRIGHLAQGFVPAILAREILIRRTPLGPGKWLSFLVVCVCQAFSSFYELIEWWVAIIGGQVTDAFLATQGDVWDTQWDMFFALLGAIAAVVTLSSVHDRALKQIQKICIL